MRVSCVINSCFFTVARVCQTNESLCNIPTSYPCCSVETLSASSERSFSSMKLINAYIHSAMGEECLTALAVLHIHRESVVNIEKVINTFASTKSRNTQCL
ncbi:hypothetical protein DPMN_088290 [Dreissena polymorpha]|uniref:HAT C-terminal dimerisation domain-containing protein n=1 Tax=Dreissena polymorpha TaxID=45954 RepID=A0A9D4KUA9_DREPO|nr:hypothetical protein DPMN_088290 [Dreissena polymorpha]